MRRLHEGHPLCPLGGSLDCPSGPCSGQSAVFPSGVRASRAPPAFGISQASPFSLKAEHLLRLAEVLYRLEPANPTSGPRKKIPFVTCPDGAVLSDTVNIQRHLEQHAGLVLVRNAQTTLVRRLLEEHLYWAQVYFRWTYHPQDVRDGLFGAIPWPLRGLVFAMVRREVRGNLWSQGMGRRPESEILTLVEEDLDTLEQALGEGPFFGGESLSAADLSCHALFAQVAGSTFDDPLVTAFRRRTGLLAHQERVETALDEGGSSCSTPS
ncbi:MAG: hypothetical protein AAGA48_39055 [Myxococcota bacterium]